MLLFTLCGSPGSLSAPILSTQGVPPVVRSQDVYFPIAAAAAVAAFVFFIIQAKVSQDREEVLREEVKKMVAFFVYFCLF